MIKYRTTEYPEKMIMKLHLLDCALAKDKAAHPQVRRQGWRAGLGHRLVLLAMCGAGGGAVVGAVSAVSG